MSHEKEKHWEDEFLSREDVLTIEIISRDKSIRTLMMKIAKDRKVIPDPIDDRKFQE